jgi:hypothetical protein
MALKCSQEEQVFLQEEGESVGEELLPVAVAEEEMCLQGLLMDLDLL